MEAKTPQFTAYDMLGYLVPGLALFAIIDLSFAVHSLDMAFTYDAVCQRYMSIKWQAAIPLLLVSYYVGHMVSFLSAMLIERYARWRYGHPMRFLLDPHDEYPKFFDTGGKGPRWSRVFRFLTAAALAPLWFWESLLMLTGVLRNYIRSMGPELIAAVQESLTWLREKAGIEKDPTQKYPAEFESLAINYTLEAAPAHVISLRNYVVLYGFLRSMTLILVMAAWLAALHYGWAAGYATRSACHGVIVFFLVAVMGGLPCVVSYGAFLKFWTRYNREAFMGLTAVYLKERSSRSFLD